MPSSLATSGTVALPASLASASRSLRMICSGECRLPIKSPPSTALERSDSHSSWISFRVAGHDVRISLEPHRTLVDGVVDLNPRKGDDQDARSRCLSGRPLLQADRAELDAAS